MPNEVVLLETKLVKFGLVVVGVVLGGGSGVTYDETAADRHALVALPP
jgi:hypothetical protein